MTRKKTTGGLGCQIRAEKSRQKEAMNLAWRPKPGFSGIAEEQAKVSVLEQSNLEDLIATVQVNRAEYDTAMGFGEEFDEGVTLISKEELVESERVASDRRDMMSIPRRPAWKEDMTNDELTALEAEAFLNWRREIALNAQEQAMHLTPYERNLDFWRQLWRTVERSDLLVQILDARDPDFYHCRDLGRYISEVGSEKRTMVLVNKADFLTAEQRKQWADYYSANGIDAIFFSALHEVTAQVKQQVLETTQSRAAEKLRLKTVAEEDDADNGGLGPSEVEAAAAVPIPDSDDDDLASDKEEEKPETKEVNADEDDEVAPMGTLSASDLDVIDSNNLLEEIISRLTSFKGAPVEDTASTVGRLRLGTVGFVGYPNVGKSTVINALVGTKKVGMSSRPGKTKHIQTLELQNTGVTLCDCPGLVFPSVVATRAHLVINNTVPLDDLIDCWDPIRLIVEKIGYENILKRYRCTEFVADGRKASGDHVLDDSHAFLSAFALRRNHMLRIGVPDENWAARKVLRDYVKGGLLHCEPPPGTVSVEQPTTSAASSSKTEEATVEAPPKKKIEIHHDEDDFDDVNVFLGSGYNESKGPKQMTKRKMRFLNKQMMKGGPVKDQGRGGACLGSASHHQADISKTAPTAGGAACHGSAASY